MRSGAAPLTTMVSLMMVSGSFAPRNSANRAAGIEVLAIQVLHVGGDVGRAPGDEPVAAERHGRRARQRRADHVEVPGRHVREVPRRRQSRAEMRIVGEQRLAARVIVPSTTQLLDPSAFASVRERGSRARRERPATKPCAQLSSTEDAEDTD